MIGLSVSQCIRDVIEGKVPLKNVEKIIGRTRMTTPEGVDIIVQIYRKEHWEKDPNEGERIFREMFAEGKIEQPRITGNRRPVILDNHWVENESDILWTR